MLKRWNFLKTGFYERINLAQDLDGELNLDVSQELGRLDGAMGLATHPPGTPPVTARNLLPPPEERRGDDLAPDTKLLVHALKSVEVGPAGFRALNVLSPIHPGPGAAGRPLRALLPRVGPSHHAGVDRPDGRGRVRHGRGQAPGQHEGSPRQRAGGGYNIYYRQDLWDGAAEHTMLHEAYEIIHETLCDMESNSPPERKVCREADRFAAAALMQPQAFSLAAERSGLDVLALQRTYRCSYASVTLRLAEVMEDRPLMTVLYEREEKGDPADWAEPPVLSATVVRRTRGFGSPATFPICGERGGVPRRGRPLSPGSLAERAVRYGSTQYAHEGGYAAIARPVLWKGRLTKVVVVAVPDSDQAVPAPSWSPPTSRRAGGGRWRRVPGS